MISPVLDPGFEPAILWNRRYESDVRASKEGLAVSVGLLRGDDPVARRNLRILSEPGSVRTFRYVERQIKFMLWAFGGNRFLVSGPTWLRESLAQHYTTTESGRFDSQTVGERIFVSPLAFESAKPEAVPRPAGREKPLGHHFEGCRIGFDLGGSDRKCASLIDGNVVFSEEVRWDPYFQKDPCYHYAGIMDSLKRAAAHLPRVDAIGGSAAGVYVNNEVRVASLFRGVSSADFESKVRRLFLDIRAEWGNVPFEVVNDGEVTALAGAMSLDDHAVLGLSMGTSLAAGYVTPEGAITSWLNELAFVPVDYREDGPLDEWSRDRGCAVQFFSQQCVARLAPRAGLSLDTDQPLAEKLEHIQHRMLKGDVRARRIYESIGVYLGYTIAHLTDFYPFRNVLILGRVTTGEGGHTMVRQAGKVLSKAFPEKAERIRIRMPDEKMKRHGQAVAAASLPVCAAPGGKN